MKFLNMAMGLSSATANHACVWCKVHKAQRHDSTASADLFNSPPVARTLEELQTGKPTHPSVKQVTNGQQGKQNKYGQKTPPLVNIEIGNSVIDELHPNL